MTKGRWHGSSLRDRLHLRSCAGRVRDHERLERFHALLTKDSKGSITNVAQWGKRSLAYPIKKKDTGFYVVAQFETAAELLPEYERAVKLDEGVLRFLVWCRKAFRRSRSPRRS